jgi:hypothetical protein
MRFPVELLRVSGPESQLGSLKLVIDDVLDTGNIANYELVADGGAEALTAETHLGQPDAQ